MRRDYRKFAHFGAPIAFLLGVTIVVLLIHGGFSAKSSKHTRTATVQTTAVTSTATTPKTVKTQIYTIRSGDTLGAVAIHFGVSVDDILALNPGIEPTALRVGQKIKVGKAPKSK